MNDPNSPELPPLLLLFPRFIEKKYKQQCLSFYRDATIIKEDGQRILVHTFYDFVETVAGHNLLVLVDSLLDCFLGECIRYAEEVLCNKDAEPLCVKFRGADRRTYWIIEGHAWAFPTIEENGQVVQCKRVGMRMLKTIRRFYDHIDVGTPTTPAAAGQALMRKAWAMAWGADWKQHRHERPSQSCVDDMRQRLIGSRSDLFVSKDERIAHVKEIDLKNAFAAAAREGLPTGKQYRFIKGSSPSSYYLVYFCEVRLRILNRLSLGPFPVKGEDGRVTYPIEEGEYVTHAWNFEIDVYRSAGIKVEEGEGYGWRETTDDMGKWVDLVSELRDSAPDKEVEFLVKFAIVAGLGRFLMPEIKYVLSEEPGVDGQEVATMEGATTWWANPVKDEKPQDMVHWGLVILAKVRVWLYQEMLRRQLLGDRLLSSNTDAFYVEAEADTSCYPSREDAKTGDWRVKSWETEENKPTFPARRWDNLKGKGKHPGQERAS